MKIIKNRILKLPLKAVHCRSLYGKILTRCAIYFKIGSDTKSKSVWLRVDSIYYEENQHVARYERSTMFHPKEMIKMTKFVLNRYIYFNKITVFTEDSHHHLLP